MAPFGKDTHPLELDARHGNAVTVVAKETRLDGELSGSHAVRVEGRVKGTVALKASLEVAVGATVEAEVQATSIRVAGTVVGNITVSELAELLAGAVVKGDITAPALHIVEGAKLEGRVHMQTERPVELLPRPKSEPEKAR